MTTSGLRLLDRAAIDACLDRDALIDGLERAFVEAGSGDAVFPVPNAVVTPNGGLLEGMPAFAMDSLAGKFITLFAKNEAVALPTHHAITVLFDSANGRPLAIFDGAHLTALRTAATTAVATKLLARPDARVLTVIGSGVQARTHLEFISGLRPFEEIRVVARRTDKAAALAKHYPRARSYATLEEAIRAADVVCECSTATAPVVRREWLAPGTHVNSIGSGASPQIDPQTMSAARVFVEFRQNSFAPYPTGSHELIGLDPRSVSELGEVLSGRLPGRVSASDLTVYKSTGCAIEDAVAARLIYDRATKDDVGMTWAAY